ncbi:MAG: 4Fe-4S binding protein [Candidatus Desulfovibrio faecigallinarum]|nr:4Fe-4S binding protein [Candidatus Desulfovibrio faecigallinarum]
MKIRLQRVIQGVSLALVLALVLFAGNGGGRPSCGPVLEARPLAGVVMHLVCREFLPSLAPALATRPYALLLVPLWEGGLALGIEAFAPFLEAAHATDLLYLQIEQGSFRTASFVLVFWLVLAVLECVRPRFWCRYLCPAGALLALFARLVPFRIVRERTCTGCGQVCLSLPGRP